MWATLRHRVRDFDSWLSAFERHEHIRAVYGVTEEHVHRGLDDPNDVVVRLRFPDRLAASAYFQDANVHDGMCRSGVVGEPTLTFSKTEPRRDTMNHVPASRAPLRRGA
jgi:hypothetical protein